MDSNSCLPSNNKGHSIMSCIGTIYKDNNENDVFVLNKQEIDSNACKTKYFQSIRCILQHANHPNIVSSQCFQENEMYYMFTLTDKLQLSLQDVMDDDKKNIVKIPISLAVSFLEQMLSAHQAVLQYDIILRCFEPENIFVYDKQIKIAAVNCPKIAKATNTVEGMNIFYSPERLLVQGYDYADDLWAIGIIFYMLVYKMHPFFMNDEKKLNTHFKLTAKKFFRKIIKPVLDEGIQFPEYPQLDKNYKDLIRLLLSRDPAIRKNWRKYIKIENPPYPSLVSSEGTLFNNMINYLKTENMLCQFSNQLSSQIIDLSQFEDKSNEFNIYLLNLMSNVLILRMNQKSIEIRNEFDGEKMIPKRGTHFYFEKDELLRNISQSTQMCVNKLEEIKVHLNNEPTSKGAKTLFNLWKILESRLVDNLSLAYAFLCLLIMKLGNSYVENKDANENGQNRLYFAAFATLISWEMDIKKIKCSYLDHKNQLKCELAEKIKNFVEKVLIGGNISNIDKKYKNYETILLSEINEFEANSNNEDMKLLIHTKEMLGSITCQIKLTIQIDKNAMININTINYLILTGRMQDEDQLKVKKDIEDIILQPAKLLNAKKQEHLKEKIKRSQKLNYELNDIF